ncbi:MAG TPA: DUF2630 family protein [Nitrospiria bacterium]|jgi:hypothetical protein|nr:DUF2630 family protein [Nitrospiria bacterium]
MEDVKVLHHIRKLIAAEEALYRNNDLSEKDKQRLRHLEVELDQCWDLLRQRRALRDVGKNPDNAAVRPPNIVENYEE